MHGGLLVTVHLSPQREHSRFEPWPGKLFCVHGRGGVTYHGLASHLGGVEILPAFHATETKDIKLRQL